MILPHNDVCFGRSNGEGLYMPNQELTTGDGVSIHMFELKSGGGLDVLMLHGVEIGRAHV